MKKNLIDIFLNDNNSILHLSKYILDAAKFSNIIFNEESRTSNQISLYDSLYFNELNDVLNSLKKALIFSIRDLRNNEFYNLIFIFCVYFLKKEKIKLNPFDLDYIDLSVANLESCLQTTNLYIRDVILDNCAYKEREKFIHSLKIDNISSLNIQNEVLTYDDIIKLSGFNNWEDSKIKQYIIKMSDTIENVLKENGKYKEIQFYKWDYKLSNDLIKEWRKISHIARHKNKETLEEWTNMSKDDKITLFHIGISICIKILK